MNSITSISDLVGKAAGGQAKKLLVVNASDESTLEAILKATESGIVEPIITGRQKTIESFAQQKGFSSEKLRIIDSVDEEEAAVKAVAIVNSEPVDIFMKGLVSTDRFMHAVLKSRIKSESKDGLLTHITLAKSQTYHKPILFTDAAIIPLPTFKQKTALLNALIAAAEKLAIKRPKVALIAATEQVIPSMPACAEAAMLSQMAIRGVFGEADVEGPLSLDIALDKKAAKVKKMASPVAGDADALLFPNLEAGNVFYKTCSKLLKAEIAAIVSGGACPLVLSSRGDSTEIKFNSIAFAAVTAAGEG